MNAYYQVFSKDGKCVLKFFPATDGGEGIDREELFEYLSIKNISVDTKALLPILTPFDEVIEIPTSSDCKFFEGEYVRVFISPDNMTVTIRLIPPFLGGQRMPKNEFLRELTSRGIKHGIDDSVVTDLIANVKYCTDYVVANGTPAVQGEDAFIEYFFNTNPKVRPTLNEDGSVDFFNLNTINHCTKGDLLAKLTPAVLGKAGVNVKGEIIRPRDVRQANLKYGRNITLSEDKTEIYSEVNGHVSLIENKVFVSNVLEVENVDNSVGNIDYEGSVKVNGNVCENFTVKAKGSIEVRGVVEGAYLESGENIIIVRGMNGMHKGTLKAEGNIISKFLENSTAIAGGYVETESIIHSTVSAGTDIHVTGKKGLISGGRVTASLSVNVKNLGSDMGADTVVEVGIDASVKQRVAELQKEIVNINKQQATIGPVLIGAKQKLQAGQKMAPDQIAQIQKLAVLNSKNTARLEECMKELSEYQEVMDADSNGQVVVTGTVFPGTKICIGDVSMVVKTEMKYCRFIKDAGDVKMAAIY